jgi:hypothetical protein
VYSSIANSGCGKHDAVGSHVGYVQRRGNHATLTFCTECILRSACRRCASGVMTTRALACCANSSCGKHDGPAGEILSVVDDSDAGVKSESRAVY